MNRLIALIAPIVACSAAPAGAQMVEAPLYANWSKFEVGTAVTLRSVTEDDGGTIEATKTQRLVSVDEKQAVVEETSVVRGEDGSTEETSQVLRYRRWFPLLPGVKEEDLGKPTGVKAEGEEELTLAGRSFACRWYDTVGQSEAGPLLTRTWYSDEVPGQVLKAVTRVERVRGTTTTELVALTPP